MMDIVDGRTRLTMFVGLAVLGCATAGGVTALHWSPPPRGPKTIAVPPTGATTASDRQIGARFSAFLAEHPDLTYADLASQLDLARARAPEAGPSFDPTRAAYWEQIREKMELTQEEQDLYRRSGMVGVDHAQHYSMAAAYLAIYRRDLPVLITTDSILHALHRSFDDILIELETEQFYPSISEVLGKAHQALRAEAAGLTSPALRRSAEDVDLYLTVARNLLAETPRAAGDDGQRVECALNAATPGCDADSTVEALSGELQIHSALGVDAKVREVLAAIVRSRAETTPALYGRQGVFVDWSQFAPRGHYTKSALLRRYFRTLMWLGRVDLGFVLGTPDPAFGGFDAGRERLDAVMLSWVLRQSGYLGTIDKMDRTIGFLVGFADDATVAGLAAAAERAGVRRLLDLSDTDQVNAVVAELARGGVGEGAIRSQIGYRAPGGGAEVPLPSVLQLFGQRFVIDSFLMSKLVFDSIQFKGRLQERIMPSGLDVAAALGNDEAVALLEPELEKWGYAANLLAARRIVEERAPAAWNGTAYDIWLSALSKLDDVPGGELPQVMRGRPWQRKQLQTQLASWAELRHDTILYAKQSYTMGIICEYPTGFVEPYPEVYARVATLAEEMGRRLDALGSATPRVATFLTEFAGIVRKLEALARKELAAEAFSKDERAWVKSAIQAKTEGGGCGPPRVIYTGWYPKLLYGGRPELWEPTIADVHTDPNSGRVLEVGVGDANFVVVAVDNRDDRAAYVGPVYSYYEFPSTVRLTDEAWRAQLGGQQEVERPEWTRAWRGQRVRRAQAPGRSSK
jgi:Protein of unknown function (DUF3160)